MARKSLNQKANDLLTEAQKLLAGPMQNGDGWIKGSQARTNKRGGAYTDALSPVAKCFCSLGVMRRVNAGDGVDPEAAHLAYNKLSRAMNGNIIACNDAPRTTFGQVMMAFDLAKEIRI